MTSTAIQLQECRTINSPAQAIWALLGDFNGLYRWHPAVADSLLSGDRTTPGSIRTLILADGAKLVEKLISLDEDGMHYRYQIIEGPLPVSGYESEIRVIEEADKRCTVRWQSTFSAAGASDEEARAVIREIYTAGLDSLSALYD